MESKKPSDHHLRCQDKTSCAGFSSKVTVGHGRLKVILQTGLQGADSFLRITGGKAHVGAVATASAESVQLSVVGIHKEGPLAEHCAQQWAKLTGQVCVAMVGIHQDQASRDEIDSIGNNVHRGLELLMEQWQQWQARRLVQGSDLERQMISWCEEAAEIARRNHRKTGGLQFKYGNEAVTQVDQQIENLLRDRIAEAFEDDLIVGEEFGGPDLSKGDPGQRIWQIDPIDGTLNYALGLPDYCISLALISGQKILAACIHQPATGDVFTALSGQGARLNGETIKLNSTRDLKDSIVSMQIQKDGLVMANPPLLHTLLTAPMKLRRCGALALELAWVAAGFYDLLVASFKDEIHLWDIAAGLLLVQEAGAVAVDFHKQPYQLGSPEMVVGSAKVADQMTSLFSV